MRSRSNWMIGLMFLGIVTTACSTPSDRSGAPPTGAAAPQRDSGGAIAASPNPVPPGSGHGTTTITWKTPDGAPGEVYLHLPNKNVPEQLFTRGAAGSAEAPWIATNATYEFRLYAGTEHRQMLGSVKVTRSAQ